MKVLWEYSAKSRLYKEMWKEFLPAPCRYMKWTQNQRFHTKEQKAVLTQKYLEDSIEKILSEHEFETEEDKNNYREMLLKQIADSE